VKINPLTRSLTVAARQSQPTSNWIFKVRRAPFTLGNRLDSGAPPAMPIDDSITDRLKNAVRTDRLVDTAVRLIEVPSPTRQAGEVCDRLQEILEQDGFAVDRSAAGWPDAPAVVVRFDSGRPGKTLQFNGHLDTVHLPFVPPRVEDGVLSGSGAIDMKGGVAAMVEALRIVRETGALPAGEILLTAHDLHEAPWGNGSQLEHLIEAGFVGDGVLIPEYLNEFLPLIGRGLAILQVTVSRDGVEVHEVLGGINQPDVIAVGADIVQRFKQLGRTLSDRSAERELQETVFVGMVHSGEIYNQSPTEFRLSGTRRWAPESHPDDVRREFFELLSAAESGTGTQIEGEFFLVRDAFHLRENDWLVDSFQEVCRTLQGKPLPTGVKPFVDDGNTFSAHGIACITHGPDGSGPHTLKERVPIAELERVAVFYALTAVRFCDA